ncbi:MAG: DUF3604 domain-containing protein [Deltaproteobacteria bacterium]|nr:DUF3604 domain-containing protein [Deltaproteobacteria bacterium]
MYRFRSCSWGLLVVVVAMLALASCKDEGTKHRCADYNPRRNLYFGDLHAHGRLSFDAYGYEVRAGLEESYAFAKGAPIGLAPLDDEGLPTREVTIDRPLDFAAMTDHVEFYAEVRMCTTPGNAAYDTVICESFREGGEDNVKSFGVKLTSYSPERFEQICGADGALCEETIKAVWQEVQDAADAAYDLTEQCTFTSLKAYEYTSTPGVTNLHRNIYFRTGTVPEMPISYFEEPSPVALWQLLDETCVQGLKGCDVMSVPHNANWSNGKLFLPDYPEGSTVEEQAAIAELRSRMEPVAEAFQHKGDMECRNGFEGLMDSPDALCDFEKIHEGELDDCGESTGMGGASGYGCSSKYDYARNVFKKGIAEQRRIGVNPYKLGVIGSTDTHNGTPGHVSEHDFPGHVGTVDDSPAKRLSEGTVTHQPRVYNPGGLAAIWAVENTREAIFDALRRGETYATSGPRIAARVFGGWSLPSDLCDREDLVKVGYKKGVPMGGDLKKRPDGASPVFVVNAVWDAGTEAYPGAPLQRIEIVKGWVDAGGNLRERLFNVAGDPGNGAAVDTLTCERSGSGFETLCAVWTDPEFDPAIPAFYYARIAENPSCRWSVYDCLALPPEEQPENSCGPDGLPEVIQERAFTSPIWYDPS